MGRTDMQTNKPTNGVNHPFHYTAAGSAAAMGTILSGRMNDLDPEDFRQNMAILVKCVSGSGLDVIGALFDLPRGTTVHNHGQFN
jgi:hypothetical protein